MLIEHEWILQLISFIRGIIKIELNILDVFKDIFLAVSILSIIGGPQAIWHFHTNFSSVVAIISLGTIILPIALIAIQIMIVDPWAILPFDRKLSRPLMTCICFLFSGIIPILLLNTFLDRREEVRKAAKRYKENISEKWQQYKQAKGYFVEYLKIELGCIHIQNNHFCLTIMNI